MNIKHTLAILTCLIFLGCGDAPPTPPAAPPEAAPADVSIAEPATVSVDVKSWEEIQKSVAQQDGKVVVLDLWSTWCEPCVREFPNLVQLHKDHPGEVVCMSFNLDYSGVASEPPESFHDGVLEFLDDQGATFTNAISSDACDDVFNALDLGSVPAVLVYGPDGQLAKRFDNDDGSYGDEGFTYKDRILPLVESLLAGDAPP